MKFFGVILYQLSLCFTVAYYVTSNFASEYLLGIFRTFFFARPVLIVLYCCMSTACELHKVYYARDIIKTRMEEEIQALNEEKQEALRKIAGLGSDESLDEDIKDAERAVKKANLADKVEGDPINSQPDRPLQGLGTIFDLASSEQEESLDFTDKNFEDELEFEHPEIPTYNELFWNFLLMPIIVYAGLGRVVVLSERKTGLMQFAQA